MALADSHRRLVAMPEEDGYTFIRKIRALSRAIDGSIPALALTAYATEEDRAESILAGFQLHLSKPINVAKLTAA